MSPGLGEVESSCSCCQPLGQVLVPVLLACPDGHTSQRKVAVPAACSCTTCSQQRSSAALSLLQDQAQQLLAQPLAPQALVSGLQPPQGNIHGEVSAEDIFGNPQSLTEDEEPGLARLTGEVSVEDIFGENL